MGTLDVLSHRKNQRAQTTSKVLHWHSTLGRHLLERPTSKVTSSCQLFRFDIFPCPCGEVAATRERTESRPILERGLPPGGRGMPGTNLMQPSSWPKTRRRASAWRRFDFLQVELYSHGYHSAGRPVSANLCALYARRAFSSASLPEVSSAFLLSSLFGLKRQRGTCFTTLRCQILSLRAAGIQLALSNVSGSFTIR